MKLKVCSVNILNDILSVKNITPYQKDRIDLLAKDIKKLCGGAPDVLYVCEATSIENVSKLAKLLKLKLIAEPYHYSKNDYMAFIVNPKKIKSAEVEAISFSGAASKNGFLRLELGGIQIFGVHYPYRAFKDMYYRYAFSRMITDMHTKESTIAVGDFNSLIFMASQLHLLRSGMSRVKFSKPPRTPNPKLHGRTAPHYVPSAVIDSMFYSNNDIKVDNARWSYSETTDHPILYAEYIFS